MRAVMCAHPKAVLAPAPRPSPPRARDARSVPARRVSSNYRAAVGGGPSAPTRGETCRRGSSSAGDAAVTSHRSRTSTGEDWRVNAFSSFCDAASDRPRVAAGLKALAQRHPSLDPSLVLFALWLAVADDGLARVMTHEEIRAAAQVAERWRGRVVGSLSTTHASLLGADLEDSPAAKSVARLVDAARREAVTAARAELFLEAERWRRFDGHEPATGDEPPVTNREAPFAANEYVRGATAAACANTRLLLEYAGALLGRTDWKHARLVFEGCMSEGCESGAGGGWDVEGDVRVWGNVDGDDVETLGDDDGGDDDGFVLSAKQWRSARGAIDARFAREKTLANRKDRNARYHEAKKNLQHANRLWKETAAEYKRARTLVKSARHEVHKSRAAVRTQFR